jgi:hypothetical protein
VQPQALVSAYKFWHLYTKKNTRSLTRNDPEWYLFFSQSQLRIYLVKYQYNTFRGVNWKILRLSKVLLHFLKKGGDDCFDVIHDFVEENDSKHICMAFSPGRSKDWHSKGGITLGDFELIIFSKNCQNLFTETSAYVCNAFTGKVSSI